MQRKMRLVVIGLFLLVIIVNTAFSQQVGPFVKYEGNPILEPQGTGFEQKAVFNPAAIVQNDTIYLLYRAEDTTGVGQWNGTSRIGLAKSTDGIHFTRRAEPVISPEYNYETPGGCEDPRIVKVGDTYYLTYTAYDGHTARLALATSQDLIHWNKYGPILPSWGWSKAGAILAEKINGQYVMYFGDSNMWIAYSDDLIHWTVDPNPVMRPRSGYFDANLVEPGPPPVLTEEGDILLIYNGADWQRYSTGWVLLSKNNPTQILARAEEPILLPEQSWERFGQVPNVVFSEGLVNYKDTWYLYYGGADTRIGVACCEGLIIEYGPFMRLGVVLEPQGYSFERDRVFNPSVIVESDTMYMIYRAQGTPSGSFLALAKSTDGINFTRYEGNPLFPGEDPRVVKFDNTYYLYFKTDPLGINLATSTDLITWTEYGTILNPVNDWESHQVKAPGPVPEKINDKYWMYYQGEQIPWHTKMGLAYSDDLFNWTHLPDPVMTPREGYFDSWGTEPGVAVIIDEGIFLIYNGWGGDGTNRNQVGWAIFDKQDPSCLIARCDSCIISMPHDHVFCEGMVEFKDEWYLYWGAADQWIEGAIVDLDKIISEAVDVAETANYVPSAYVLMQNYPNPFNPSTEIQYYLPEAGYVRLKVYNILGQEIKALVNNYQGIGPRRVCWDGTNNIGEKVAGGVYFYSLEAGTSKMTKKMILLK